MIKKTQGIFALITILMVCLVGVSFVSYNGKLSSHIQKDVETRLQESVQPNLISFNLQMEEQIKKVNTFAEFLGNNQNLTTQVQTSLLQSAVENNGLLRCAIAYPDGSFITHDNKNEGSVASDKFFIENMKGNFFITDPRPAVVDPDKTVILFSAPIQNEFEEVIGSVIYSYLCDDMNQIFNLKAMGGSMNMLIVKQSGHILIGQSDYAESKGDLFTSLGTGCTHQTHQKKNCLKMSGESGVYQLTYNEGRHTTYVRYDKLGYNDWYMLATISESKATKSVSFAAQNQRELSILVSVIILLYLIVLLIIWLKQRRQVDVDTGLLTIYAFRRKAKKVFKHRTSDSFVVVKLDVKDFKLINRIHSFAMGDKVIKNIAESLKHVLNVDQSICARVGVDTFVFLMPYCGREALQAKRQDFLNHFRMLTDEAFSTRISFPTGQYILKESDFPKPDIDELLEKVNFAHRAAKHNVEHIIDYEEDIENTALLEKKIEDRMDDAIKEEEFALYLQPKVRLKDESLCGAEALVRWKVDGKYYMYPTDFVPILEKNGFIVQLDKYMFDCAARVIKEHLEQGREPVPISVNFSRHHLRNENLVAELCEITDQYQIPRKYLEVELTESAFLGHVEDITLLINRLHEAGFLISMDDFGSGYSCFAQLKDLNIDIMKLDKEFFTQNMDDERARVVIAGIIKMAKDLQITTVAEGIEHKEQIDMLRTLECDIVQGYYYGRPAPAKELDMCNYSIPEFHPDRVEDK